MFLAGTFGGKQFGNLNLERFGEDFQFCIRYAAELSLDF